MAESRERETTGRREGGPLSRPRTPSGPLAKVFQPGLPTGMGLGKYRILERIKTTHNAIIYKARDVMLDRLVTVKQMSPSLIDDPIACGHFRREAQFLARIPRGTSHVIGIHELIEDDLGLFIVEEYLPGDWLESLIAKRQIDLSAALRVLKTTALGLRTLHSMRITHRGIHPGNILVARNGKAKITNLSTAAREADNTPPPVIAPKYAAPELLLGEEYDDRVDIYSLGVILFEMCVGRPALNRHFADLLAKPADAKTRWIEWHLDPRTALPNATDLNPVIPPQLAVLIHRMTAKNLDERLASIQEVLRVLWPTPREQRGTAANRPTCFGLPAMWHPEDTLGLPPYAGHSQPATRALPYPAGNYPAVPRTAAQASTYTVSVADPGQTGKRAQTNQQTPTARPLAEGLATRPRQRPRTRKPGGMPRLLSRVEVVPVPETATQPLKEKPVRMLPRLIAATITLAVLTVVGVGVWKHLTNPATNHPIVARMKDAETAYQERRWEAAERLYAEAAQLEVPTDLRPLQGKAGTDMLLAQAARAIDEGQLDNVKTTLDEAQRRGGDSARIGELQKALWNKTDVHRLRAAMTEEIRRGDYPAAESKTDEFEKKARAAGVNPNEMRVNLEQSREERRYAESINRAEAALTASDYDAALLACTDAENIKVTTETRKLHKRTLDLKKRAEWTVRGDDAMIRRDFRTAAIAYENAIQLEPSEELEIRARMAGAHVLYEEALADIAKGDLLTAEQKLQTSYWRFASPEIKAKLSLMAPAFDAARLARRADWAMEREDYPEAAALYVQALPKLPEPANAAVQRKLLQAQQAEANAKKKGTDQPGD